MDKKSAQPAAQAKPKDPEAETLQSARAIFDQVLENSRKQREAEGDVEAPAETEQPAEKPKKAPKAAAKPVKEKPAPEPTAPDYASMERELAELKSKVSEKEKAPEKTEKKPDALESVKRYLAEQFGDTEGEALGNALESIVTPLMARTEQLEKILQEATKRGRDTAAKSNRARIGEKFPHILKQDAAWKILKEQAEALATKEPTRFESPEDVYDFVADSLYGHLAEEDENEDQEDDEEAERVAASAMTPPSRTKAPRKLSQEERSRAVFAHLLKNPDDLAGAKKVARQLRVS